jgi:starch phosphorylase
LNDPERPVQILFSGKAHPHNDAGKELIRAINNFARQDGFRGRIVFIEDYNINVSRSLVSGVDIWLNNPRRPLEASGTSGQKVPINGGINFSVLDGWWPEGYNGQNGWVIGTDTEHPDANQQDYIDANSFYDTLENEIIPLYYDNNGSGWIKTAKESLASLLSEFSTHTMLMNYIKKYYVPGMKRYINYTENDYAHLFHFNRWVNRVNRHWKKTSINFSKKDPLVDEHRILSPGESKEVGVRLHLEGLKPEEVIVELVLERQDAIYRNLDTVFHTMGLIGENGNQEYEYRVLVTAKTNGSYRYNCRVIPTHSDFFSKHETRLVKWLD